MHTHAHVLWTGVLIDFQEQSIVNNTNYGSFFNFWHVLVLPFTVHMRWASWQPIVVSSHGVVPTLVILAQITSYFCFVFHPM